MSKPERPSIPTKRRHPPQRVVGTPSGSDKQSVPKKRPGRRPGKHSDENYTQTSIYLPIELRNRVRAKLYEKGMEMSGLVEDMLEAWLGKQK